MTFQEKTGSAEAVINWLNGPVLRARTEETFHTNEAVVVGKNKLLGEVIRVKQGEIVVQVYEDTTGLQPGDRVRGHGLPLSIKLGPGILGNIFDGLLRPLTLQAGNFIQPGLSEIESQSFQFKPSVKVNDAVTTGQIFGKVEPHQGMVQRCLIPPHSSGQIQHIVPAGTYADDETLCVLIDDNGEKQNIAMSHLWPVRRPRPVISRSQPTTPLFTGQRILDSLFPLTNGGRAAMPGGFGTGKTVLQETLAKWCDADVIVYVGCGERGNEIAGVLHEFPSLTDPRTGRALMERTVIIANTSNMPVAAREASIYTAVTIAEYFRDQGLRVALMADSTSRWAEALREVSGRLGELPSEAGYPAYLSSRLADFYERAAQVTSLSGQPGSLTIIGAVSPPSADFSEPVTTHTKRYIRCFWALDATRAQARFYPAIHPLLSYSEHVDDLKSYWKKQGNPQWLEHRRQFLGLLEQQSRLERMARVVGKDALPPRQQHILLCADLINEGFLRQSAYSPTDRYCSPARQGAMMRLIIRFIELTAAAIEKEIDINEIYQLPVLRKLRRMGEDIGEDQLDQFQQLTGELEASFAHFLQESGSHAH